MSSGTIEVLHGEAGDDRAREAEIAKLHEMYERPTVPEPELPVPGPGDFVIHRMGVYGTHLAFNRHPVRFH
jgi:hypothetical protein